MNRTEFNQLPDDLKRDVRCAVACGYDFNESIDGSALLQKYRHIWVWCDEWGCWRAFEPTTDRTIWAGLLEAFPMHTSTNAKGEHFASMQPWMDDWQSLIGSVHEHLSTAIVCEFVRRDPLGHIGRAGL
jgi:hypothetical protein